ncbi:MAG: DUF366 family protein [Candidatus Margulisbacteria bacterium]|nr:DUF366 family protein [Candidatus Margulisiibacteriota bacterium]
MKSFYIDKELFYKENHLHTNWFLNLYKIKGDAILAFVGASSENNKESTKLLHFIIRHNDMKLREMLLRHRYFLTQLCHLLPPGCKRHHHSIYFSSAKIAYSIVKSGRSSSSMAILLYLNAHKPKSIGLNDLDIMPKDFAILAMQAYTEEMNELESLESTHLRSNPSTK